MDIEKYRRLFVEEATDHLAEMARALASLESRGGGDPEAAIDTLFRMAHSIKGMASSLDYDSVASVAHRLEDWLEPMRDVGVLPAAGRPLVYEVVGLLEEMVAAVEQTGVPPASSGDLLERLAQPLDLDASDREAGAIKKGRSSHLRRSRARSGSAPRRSTGSWPRWVS